MRDQCCYSSLKFLRETYESLPGSVLRTNVVNFFLVNARDSYEEVDHHFSLFGALVLTKVWFYTLVVVSRDCTMAEGCSAVDGVFNNREKQEEHRVCPVNNIAVVGRRPLSDSSIKYEENAFQDSSEVILVNFGERRNSLTLVNSDGDTSDEVDGEGTSDFRTYLASSSDAENSLPPRARKGTKASFVCDCQQSQKSKRKAASKLVNVSSVEFVMPIPPKVAENGNRGGRRKDSSLMNKVKKWFGDLSSPTHFENNEAKWPKSSSSQSKTKGTEVGPLSRSSKKDLYKGQRHYLIRDILAVTNCSYYWGKINRHEAEEV